MEWYEKYFDDVYRFIFFMIGERQCCEDLVHDTFVRAFTSFERFESRGNAKTWLFGIAKYLVLDEIRKRKRRKLLTVLGYDKEIASPFDVEQYVENRESVLNTMQAIQMLKPDYRLVITLKKIEECSTKEICEILGWSEAKVRKTLSRAIQALKKQEKMEGGSQIEQSL